MSLGQPQEGLSTPQTTPQNTPQSRGDRKQLWRAAIKLPMYSVAVMPIWVGSSVAVAQTGQFRLDIFLLFLGSAIAILAWENLSNDVYDSETGIDVNKAHSVVNLTGRKSLVFWLGNALLVAGLLGVLVISWRQQDLTVLTLILICCFLGYTYQGPPFRLGYQGLGEIICFFCFGPLAVSAAYYSQTQTWSWVSLAVSVVVGVATSLILFCSHFHQLEDDRQAGKRSPIVRLGTLRASQLLPWAGGSVYAVTLLGVLLGQFPVAVIGVLASLPTLLHLTRHVGRYHNHPKQVSNCKFIAVKLHFWSNFLLGLGFWWPGS